MLTWFKYILFPTKAANFTILEDISNSTIFVMQMYQVIVNYP